MDTDGDKVARHRRGCGLIDVQSRYLTTGLTTSDGIEP